MDTTDLIGRCQAEVQRLNDQITQKRGELQTLTDAKQALKADIADLQAYQAFKAIPPTAP